MDNLALLSYHYFPPRPWLKPQCLHHRRCFLYRSYSFFLSMSLFGWMCGFHFVGGEGSQFPGPWIHNFDEFVKLIVTFSFFL